MSKKLSLNKETLCAMTEADARRVDGAARTRYCESDPCLSDMCTFTRRLFATACYIP